MARELWTPKYKARVVQDKRRAEDEKIAEKEIEDAALHDRQDTQPGEQGD